MLLILGTPALQAHSALRYADWRQVIAEHVADRTGGHPDDLLPRTVGHVALGLALSAYEQRLAEEDEPLEQVLAASFAALRTFLAETPRVRG